MDQLRIEEVLAEQQSKGFSFESWQRHLADVGEVVLYDVLVSKRFTVGELALVDRLMRT